MGYNVHITTKTNWYDAEPDKEISLAAWKAVIKKHTDLKLEDAKTGAAYWPNLSPSEQNRAWIYWSNGNITAKNPTTEMIKRMHKIATGIDAIVQGDDGEHYRADGSSDFKERRAAYEQANRHADRRVPFRGRINRPTFIVGELLAAGLIFVDYKLLGAYWPSILILLIVIFWLSSLVARRAHDFAVPGLLGVVLCAILFPSFILMSSAKGTPGHNKYGGYPPLPKRIEWRELFRF